MLRKIFFVILVIISFFVPRYSFAISQSIVIYSFKVAGEKTTDEFVELSNMGDQIVNISGWQLAKKTATGNKYNLVTEFPLTEIKPGESVIVGHKDSTSSPDIYYSTDYSISEDNTILLFSDSGKTLVDKVGFGKAIDYESEPLAAAKTSIWTRKGPDTDNNLKDFGSVQDVIQKDFSGLCVTELVPSPSDGKEWIEVYNSEITKDISGLVIADKLGSIKRFTVPEGTVINEGQYLVFYSDKTGISLNNDGDGVVLIDGSGKIFDDTGESFGKSEKGSSYAFDGEKWEWTKTPTPGAKNIITQNKEAQTVGAITSRKRTNATSQTIVSTKGKAPAAEVAGAQDSKSENSIFDKSNRGSASDRMLGIIFIGVAILAAFAYTLYVNWEKISATFNIEREGYSKSWEKIRQGLQRWRDLSFVRRIRRR